MCDVRATNNAAERALRCAAQWRKTRFGSRNATGEVAMACILAVNAHVLGDRIVILGQVQGDVTALEKVDLRKAGDIP